MKRRSIRRTIVEVIVLVASIMFVAPIVITFLNSFKQMPEISKSFFSIPAKLDLSNYMEVYRLTKMDVALFNSFLLVVCSLIGIIWFSAMASYVIARLDNYYNKVIYSLFVMGLIIPFAVIMIPLMKIVGFFHLQGRFGLIVIYVALGLSKGVFLMTGFIKSSVPIELEESVVTDGGTGGTVFRKVVIPLIKPIIVTLIMLDTIWIWNDFLLPSLMLTKPEWRTLPLSQFRLVGDYVQKWNLQFAAFSMMMIPLFIFFLLCQKHIVKGLSAGSLKG
jgi:raffinose/stachyose/melibiose transport system permease protein